LYFLSLQKKEIERGKNEENSNLMNSQIFFDTQDPPSCISIEELMIWT